MENIVDKIKKEKLIQYIKRSQNISELKTIEKSILDKNDPFLSYLFAKEIKSALIPLHLNVVVNSNDYQIMYTFAMEIECDKTPIQNAIIKSKNAKWIYFLSWAKGVDIKLLEDAIIETGDLYYIYRFGVDVPGANQERIAKLIIANGNIEYMYLLGRLGINHSEREYLIKNAEKSNIKNLKNKR